MPYQRILQDLLRSVPGAQAALLLDVQGEVVVEAGPRDERYRLIAAYQGITLSTLQRAAERHAAGDIRHVVSRHQGGSVVLRPLRDGYYLVFALAPGADLARGLHRSAVAQDALVAEL
jgi:predicted regulator of Ras-like GTPase activity (Roadblock/LC7/MglB family)